MDRDHRDLQDFVFRIVGSRGDSSLVDPDSSDLSSRNSRTNAPFVDGHIRRVSVSRDRSSVSNVDRWGTFSFLVPDQDSRHHRRHRLLPYLRRYKESL